MPAFIALLRGINVSGRNTIPMAELRALCEKFGATDVRTYIQSGNVVFAGTGRAPAIEAALEAAIEQRFGIAIPVIVRATAQWPGYMEGNPFPEASAREPSHVLMGLAKAPPRKGAVEALRERATAGERIEAAGDALRFHFAGGVARSKLTPALIDRLVGSAVTARNWRTVQKLGELAAGG